MLTVRVVPRREAPRKVHIDSALRRALYVLDEQQNMLEAWSGFVSDMVKHPETEQHPVIWEGTKRITDGKIFTVHGLRELLERTARAEREAT